MFILIIAALLVLFPAYYKFRTDRKEKYRAHLFICAIIGATIGSYTGYTSKVSERIAQDSLKKKDALYRNLLTKNLINADTIIQKQNLALQKLTGQINQNQQLLSNTKQTLSEMARENNPLMDIKLNCDVTYPMAQGWQFENYVRLGAKPFSFFDLPYKFPTEYRDVSEVILSQIRSGELHRIDTMDVINPINGSGTSYPGIWYTNKYVTVTCGKKGRDTFFKSLFIDQPEVYNSKRTIFDSYALGVGEMTSISFFKRSRNVVHPYDLTQPDMVLGFDHSANQVKIDSSVINLTAKNMRESLSLKFTKLKYNGHIRSLQDLDGALMLIEWDSFLPHFNFLELKYGEHYVNVIKLDPKALHYKNLNGSWQLTYQLGRM